MGTEESERARKRERGGVNGTCGDGNSFSTNGRRGRPYTCLLKDLSQFGHSLNLSSSRGGWHVCFLSPVMLNSVLGSEREGMVVDDEVTDQE